MVYSAKPLKKIIAVILIISTLLFIGSTVYGADITKDKMVIVKTSDTESEAAGRVVFESFEGVDVVPTEFATQQEEVVYKMLNSVDYFSNASVSFSALFPGFDTEQNYTIETNIDTGISHQTCSDNLAAVRSADKAEAYETYLNGSVVREYNNLERTVKTVSNVQERRTLSEEWPGLEDRYFVDENGEPHYRYRSNPTNADMAGECLLPQVSAFAYLMDRELWSITAETEYCGRDCYSIEGTVNESYSSQIGADTFMMYVDKSTGILLKLEAYALNGNVVSSMIVSDIIIDAPTARTSFEYDMSKYEGYTEITR